MRLHPSSFFIFKNCLLIYYIGAQLFNNVVSVSSVQQSDSVIHVSLLFQIRFPFRLLQTIQQHSLCYTVGPCWSSILFIYFYTFFILLAHPRALVLLYHTHFTDEGRRFREVKEPLQRSPA